MKPAPKAELLIRGIGQLATLAGPEGPRRGAALGELGLVAQGALAAAGGRILAAGPEAAVLAACEPAPDCLEIAAGGALVTPAYVDPHTHALFGRYRYEEFALRVAGRPYLEIAAAGGGIHASVADFRCRSDEELLALSRPRLKRMLLAGSATIEVKTGYGLDLEQELRGLRLIAGLAEELAVRLVPTFLGAHEIPPERRADRADYVEEIVGVWLPAVAAQGIARFADVFCEPTVFTLAESERLLRAAQALGLGAKLHADEIAPGYGAAALAAGLGAVSAEHLIAMAERDIAALAAAPTVAVLLPATSLGLASTQFAPARRLVDAGAAVALATDYNPGSSCCESMGLVLALAASALRLSPAEALCAATHNAAWACGEGRETGSLLPGKRADLILHDAADYRELPYHIGFPSARLVFAAGRRLAFAPEECRDRPLEIT
ncbi:imidazolonepropionase [bacterium]|nr:imidazolonepropionase [bacterium]